MADGPRCKRRKQANPKRSSSAVTDFNNGLEASSDSDDEDKLHIVEDEALQEPEAAAAATATATADATEATTPQESHDADADAAAATVLPHNGSWNGVKEEYVSEEEEEEEEVEVKDALVEKILQQGDTAVIYPEAPEDEQSPVETVGADENGTPDSFSQLHTCPYCSRGYKRNASLKEHIKYRHETSEDNYSCSHCSYTFTYRSQLERHMSHHRGNKDQRHVTQPTGGLGGTGGNRKFKCTECFKAFKYKHHLKEHLRIHSGEKPYECSNCKKRFSHSGSYSSHISSKKCVGAALPNGVARAAIKSPAPTAQMAPVIIAPARMILKEKAESKPLQEQLPVTQIKSEPVEYACKPAMAATSANGVVNGGTAQPTVVPATTLPQGMAMVVPTMGLMSPISINLSDLQNVLKVAMDGNVLRQVLGSANGVVTQGKQGIVVQQPQQQIISLPAFVDHDGTTKIIINYSIGPAAGTAATTQQLLVKSLPPPAPTVISTAAAAPSPADTDKPSTPEAADLSIVKAEPESPPVTHETGSAPRMKQETFDNSDTAHMPKANSTGTCLLCDDCPDNLEALHLLQHRKAANGEAVDSAALDPSFAALLSEAGVTLEQEPPVEDVVALLKNYFASNANPGEAELAAISEDVSIPVDVVRKWFAKMNAGKKLGRSRGDAKAVSRRTQTTHLNSNQNGEEDGDGDSGRTSTSDSPSINASDLVIVKSEPEDPEAPDSQAEPLDLSLPKHVAAALQAKAARPPAKQQEQPLNLTCLRKEQLGGRTIYVTTQKAGGQAVKIVSAAQLPTLVAIAGQGCLSAINATTKRTILIPQLTYTYATTGGGASGAKTVVLNGHKEEKRVDSSSDGVSAVEEQNDSDPAGLMKKRRLENGVYPCDLCSKVFQKGSSLLRHKYEHTGKRPHECHICKKAFKHKHHLIEHSRLHSGEKPYQCDKCGKRFSHSGSYSQHMNHRYSYCKRGDRSSPVSLLGLRRAQMELGSPSAGPQSDSRTTTPPSQLDSDERESGEEEDEDDEAMCMDDIRVVQVDDGECEIYEGNFDDDDDEEEEEDEEEDEVTTEEETGIEKVEREFACDVVEIELGDDHMVEEEAEGRSEKKQEAAEGRAEEKQEAAEGRAEEKREAAEGRAEEKQEAAEGRAEEKQEAAEGRTEEKQEAAEGRAEEKQEAAGVETAEIKEAGVEAAEMETPDVEAAVVEKVEIKAAGVETPDVEAAEMETADVEAAVVEKVEIKAAGVETPDVEAAEMETADVEAVEMETPDVETPDVETPGVETPGVEAAGVEAVEMETPDVETPDVETPGVEAAGVEAVEMETPDVETPGVEAAGVEAVEMETPDVETPGVKTPGVEAAGVEAVEMETPDLETPGVEAAGVEAVEMEDCEAETDKSIREESAAAEPTEEVETNAK